jgi:hypothetical protein
MICREERGLKSSTSLTHFAGVLTIGACEARKICIVDAHGYGRRFIVRADEILTAFLELERAIHEFAVDLIS